MEAVSPAAVGGFSVDQMRELAEARARWKKIRRAITIAKLGGWATGIFAALTLLGALLMFSWVALLIGAGMAIVSYVEFKGAAGLLALDPRAARRLAWNQIFFGTMLFAYGAFSLHRLWNNPGALSPELSTHLASWPEMIEMVDDVVRLTALLIYGTLMLVAVTIQGGTALFYLSRRKHLRRHLEQTAPWIIHSQRAGMRL